MIKLLLGVSLLASSIYADKEYTLNGKKYIHYNNIIAKSVNREGMHSDCFYKNGIISKESCYIQTRSILVSFVDTDLIVSNFTREYNLEEIKETNSLFKTILFKISDERIDIINLVNEIKKKYPKLTVRVNWKRPRSLR